MNFLKEVLGDELFAQFETAINAFNGNEANKDKQIKLANLGTGEYVGKGKFDSEIEKLQNLLNGKTTELDKANGLIAELEKTSKGNEDALGKISEYKAQAEKLQKELAETKMKSAIKVALLSEKAVDVDYLTYCLEKELKEKGETLELDDNDNIKGWNDRLNGLKTKYPTMFETGEGSDDGYKVYNPEGLPSGGKEQIVTKEQFKTMSYEQRVALKQKNEKLYNTLRG